MSKVGHDGQVYLTNTGCGDYGSGFGGGGDVCRPSP